MRANFLAVCTALSLLPFEASAAEFSVDVANETGYKSPIFDIKLVDEECDSYTFWDVDVSERDITATIKNLDK